MNRSTAEELTDADADVGGCIVFPARIKRLSIHYLGFTSLVFRDAWQTDNAHNSNKKKRKKIYAGVGMNDTDILVPA